MFTIGSIVDLEITDLSISGEGVGNVQGFTIFVEGSLPTEKVQAEITLLKKTMALLNFLK